MTFEGSFMYINGKFCPAGEPVRETDSVTYDVVRVIGGIPLFLEEHLDRIDTALEKLEEPSRRGEIVEGLFGLIGRNGSRKVFRNVKILAGGKLGLVMGFVASSYPEKELYSKGVDLVTASLARENPELKVWKPEFKKRINEILQSSGAYEVLLVNGEGRVTEGSRSNVFFVRDSAVYTPASGVLPGITRQKVQESVENEGIKLYAGDIYLAGLEDFEGAFITGTSPKVLPAKKVDGERFNPGHPVISRVMEDFEREVQKDLERCREKYEEYIREEFN